MAMDQPPAASRGAISISRERYERLRVEQSLFVALFAGIAAAIVGAIAWAAVTITTEYQIGLMAIAVGFIVGFAVRMGNGIDKIFGILGAVLSLFGCVLGNLFSIIGFVSKQEHLSLTETISRLDYSKIPAIFRATFSVMDMVFYGIAVYEGYRFSFRRINAEEVRDPETPTAR
jgi:hypothetical protein